MSENPWFKIHVSVFKIMYCCRSVMLGRAYQVICENEENVRALRHRLRFTTRDGHKCEIDRIV